MRTSQANRSVAIDFPSAGSSNHAEVCESLNFKAEHCLDPVSRSKGLMMRQRLENPWVRLVACLAGFALLTGLSVAVARVVVTPGKVCPDFICFWSAGQNLASAHSPYDSEREVLIQHRLGWVKQVDGIGLYDFLPYFYPPWFGMLFIPLLPFGYATAKIIWLVISIELLAIASYLLRKSIAGLPRAVPPIVVFTFSLTIFSVLLGQTTPLMFFLIVAIWRLLDEKWDWCAGSVMAWLTVKPQLTGILLLGLILWVARRGRSRVIQGFSITMCALVLVSTLLVPTWPIEMLRATTLTPLPTQYFPWYGTAWLLVLRSVGLHSWGLWAFYLALAVPFLVWVLRKALDRTCSLQDLIAVSTLSAFFVAPYCQPYDFPVLLIPFFVLLGGRLTEKASTLLLLTIIIIPHLHIKFQQHLMLWWLPAKPAHQVTLFWVPILLTVVWLGMRSRSPSWSRRLWA